MTRSYYMDEEDIHDNQAYHKDRQHCCTTKTKCVILLLVLLLIGGAAGVVFGIFDMETVKSWFGLGSDDGSNGGSSNGDPQEATPYDFWQCPAADTGDCCNGLESICDLRVNQVLFATVHNANHDNGTAFSNNLAPLEGALEAGYRGLMLDVCKCVDSFGQDEIIFCHSTCAFGTRDPIEVFTNINEFLNRNPSETLVINFELSFGDPTASDLWDVLQGVNGISTKTFTYQGGNWPTLREMRNLNKQLILFKHGGQSCASAGVSGCVDFIQEFHEYAMETKYEFTSVDDVENSDLSCTGDRGTTGSRDFYAINNFVANGLIGTPSQSASEHVNEKLFLQQRLKDCETQTGLKANFINVDFWQTGDVIQVTQEENKRRAFLSV